MKTYDERSADVLLKLNDLRARRKKRKRIAAAACLSLSLVILALVLFVPYSTTPPDVSQYSASPYYSLIQSLNELTYTKPSYKNNFEKWLSSAKKSLDFNFAVGGMAPSTDIYYDAAVSESNGSYVEVTDNQVQGVTESDIIKRSDRYIYYLSGDFLNVYSIAGEESELVGTYYASQCTFPEGWEEGGFGYTASNVEMYLSTDCTTITVLMNSYQESIGACVLMVSLDVTNPADIRTIEHTYFTGSIVSSRLVDGDILLTYNYNVKAGSLNFEDTSTFVPTYGKPGSMTALPAEDIICPENADSTRYTVVCRLDSKTLEVKGSTALLSYSQELYVSADTIYATHAFTQKSNETADGYTSTSMTEITGISYAGDDLTVLGTVAVEGTVKDQYSMDQYEGVLRLVTTTAVADMKIYTYDGYSSARGTTQRNVNLYCVDLSDWSIAASVTGFAPEGEEATSVRFDGPNAYVCTAQIITLTDPVYFFDLSDLEHITYTDTGTINGYSTSLIQLGGGYLLGIGYSDIRGLKVEVYEETAEGVVSVCAYERAVDFSETYKSYLIDREKNIIGLGIWDGSYQYVLLHFDGYQLNELARVPLNDGAYLEKIRACLIDGCLYILAPNQTRMQVQKVW